MLQVTFPCINRAWQDGRSTSSGDALRNTWAKDASSSIVSYDQNYQPDKGPERPETDNKRCSEALGEGLSWPIRFLRKKHSSLS